MIDKRHTQLKIQEVIKPGFTKRFAGEGLPYPKDPSRRGDLIVEFDIIFPETMSSLKESEKKVFANYLPKILK